MKIQTITTNKVQLLNNICDFRHNTTESEKYESKSKK